MFGHQDNTDDTNNNNQDQTDHSQVDNYINDLNDSVSVPAPPEPPKEDNQATTPPVPPSEPTTDDHTLNLPDQPGDQIVDLVDIKTKALDELYPIVHKLDLSAEENFKTLMMMIQATDNKDLLSQAYQTAEKIEDEAARARALLDIVNEINYFTNHPSIDQ